MKEIVRTLMRLDAEQRQLSLLEAGSKPLFLARGRDTEGTQNLRSFSPLL
jgi:hypothetical protein